jgi:hypothetical protein
LTTTSSVPQNNIHATYKDLPIKTEKAENRTLLQWNIYHVTIIWMLPLNKIMVVLIYYMAVNSRQRKLKIWLTIQAAETEFIKICNGLQ